MYKYDYENIVEIRRYMRAWDTSHEIFDGMEKIFENCMGMELTFERSFSKYLGPKSECIISLGEEFLLHPWCEVLSPESCGCYKSIRYGDYYCALSVRAPLGDEDQRVLRNIGRIQWEVPDNEPKEVLTCNLY